MRSFAALCLAAALVAGCDAERQASARASAASAVAAAPTEGGPSVALRPDERGPGPGELFLRLEENGLRLDANAAPRLAVLRALQAHVGFSLEVVGGGQLGPPLTARLVGASPDDVLALALVGAPHALRYQPLAGGGRQLVAVRVGAAAGPPPPARPPLAAAEPPEASGARQERFERSQAERARALASDDPSVRAAAATWIHADSRSLALLGAALLDDASPEVRAAAAQSLGEASDEDDARNATDWLIQALDDPDGGVVVAALEALEWVADASVVPRLEPLLSHPDPAVREQARDTIEWVED